MLAIPYVFALLAVPLALHLRGHGPAALFASVAIVHVVFAALVSIWSSVAPGSFVWAFAPDQALRAGAEAMRDRHAESNGPARKMGFLAAVWVAIALTLWLAARWQALYVPVATKGLFRAMNLSLLVSCAATVWMSFLVLRRGTPPAEDVFELATNLKFAAGPALTLSLAGLLALLVDAFFRRLRHGPTGV